jgi:exodeoxyribonuclease VII large subunit
MNLNVPSVSQVVHSIKETLELNFRSVSVSGELSNFSHSSSGHYYFTLSDKEASLSSVLFRMDAMRNPVIKRLKDGDQVICTGPIGVYARRGQFQLICKQIVPVGKGTLKEKLELLKKKLQAEGLFDLEYKKTIPHFPARVGVVTAERSAAFQDFIKVVERRSNGLNIVLSPALVQGEAAPASIRHALTKLIKLHLEGGPEKQLDAIVVTRGGGSLEDLWAFNDEGLAWDLYNCPVPVISAVGHEVDFSISDYVADKRCETPTAAAEVLTQHHFNVIEKLENARFQLKSCMEQKLLTLQSKISHLHPHKTIGVLKDQLARQYRSLERINPTPHLHRYTGLHDKVMLLEDHFNRLKMFPMRIESYQKRLEHSAGLLRVMDPHNVLGRGYTYITTESGQVVSTLECFKALEDNDLLNIRFQDGQGQVKK